ncbi:MAG: zinc-dependent peptidase [Candidatus Bipolaricaulis sp.]|nr:zinc-dependent peptidase [Candidatus Bipolaricaulis sp.]
MRLVTRLRLRWIRRRPFSPEWRRILERTFPRYLYLSPGDRDELERHIQVFLAEKQFEGAAGQPITDEVRVTIAAQACFLLLHRDTAVYPRLFSIIVYPGEYAAHDRRRDERGFINEGVQIRRGETAGRGALVLSWSDVLQDASDIHSGRNVVFHEFAHELDREGGSFDGAPVLPKPAMNRTWARTLSEEFHALRGRLARNEPTDLDPYGATNPAEFFAVVTESFFQRPHELRQTHPKLYEELERFYRQDPASTLPPA